MIRAFIVKVDLDDISQLADDAIDIENACDKAGIPVVSVVPWRGHGMIGDQTPNLIPPITPETQSPI